MAFLFTTIYGLSKNEVLKLDEGEYYCKNDICVEKADFDTIIIPNSEGKNTTLITSTCSARDIGLDLCSSKECTADSQCLSNKCLEGHCTFNEANPITHCQYVRTVHNDPIFGDPYGYKMICGLPKGDKCKSNKDCSSYNCETYSNDSICGEPDDSGCRSMCGMGRSIFVFFFIPIIIILLLCALCIVCCVRNNKKKSYQKKENDKDRLSV